jgi:hypothetical protein
MNEGTPVDVRREGPDGQPLTVRSLAETLVSLDPDAIVVVGIINGGLYTAAYANAEAGPDGPRLYIGCYEQPREER